MKEVKQMRFLTVSLIVLSLLLAGCQKKEEAQTKESVDSTSAWQSKESHLSNIKQLTFGGENAEAYFSYKADLLIYQSTHPPYDCDQIFMMNSDGSNKHLISDGKGRTTCSFIAPDYKRVIYSSTFATDTLCPPKPDYSQGYVWALYPGFEIYSANLDGSDPVDITNSARYDAEAVYSPDGSRIVFTSLRTGDLEIFSMNPDGSDVKQLTHELGYDGGPFYSFDGKKIVYRAYHPQTAVDSADYVALLDQNLIRPTKLELFIMDADGSNKKQITHLDCATFAPYLNPDGKRVIFCSNYGSSVRDFSLWMINVDGTGLERITYNPTFDGFPMWSHDGRKFVFCSNRSDKVQGETNVFIADWHD